MAAKFTIGKIQDFAISSSPRYFGSEVGRHGNTVTYSVNCYKIDVSNIDVGVSSTLVDYFKAARNSKDYLDLDLNGELIKNAKLIDFNIEEGNLQKQGLISLVFEKYDGDSTISDTGYYEGYDDSVAKHFEDFSENFEFNETEDRKSITHTINFSLRSEAGDVSIGTDQATNYASVFSMPTSTTELAHKFAKSAFDARNDWDNILIGTGLKGFNQQDLKRRYTENIDFINNKFSYSEILDLDLSTKSGDIVNKVITQSITKRADGIVVLTERGDIEGISGTMAQRFSGASGVANNALTGSSRGRLLAFYMPFSGADDLPFPEDCNGKPKAPETTFTQRPLEGRVSYSYIMRNAYNADCGCSGFYNVVDNVSTQACYANVTRVITTEGVGDAISGTQGSAQITYPKFENAKKMMFQAQSNNNCLPAGKSVYEYFADSVTPSPGAIQGYSPSPISSSWSYNKKAGTVAVTLTYSSHPKYSRNKRDPDNYGGKNNWYKVYEVKTSEISNIKSLKKFPFLNSETDAVMGQKGVLIQKSPRSSVGSITKTITIKPVRGPDFTVRDKVEGKKLITKILNDVKTEILDKEIEGMVVTDLRWTYTVGSDSSFVLTVTCLDG